MQWLATYFGRRDAILAGIAIVLGIGIAYFDSQPTWDDTAITAALLLLTAGMVSGLSGRRPWLWAVLIGAWTPLIEVTGGEWGSVLALGAAAIGSLMGYYTVRAGAPGGVSAPPTNAS